MKVRDHYIAKAQTLADSATTTIDIPKGLKIQELRVKVGATNGATSNTVGKVCSLVSKLELVDGSDVLHSVSMCKEQALNFYTNGRFPRKELSAGAAVAIFEEALMQFGRYFRDREYYLDTGHFSNPQFRMTHAFTVSATAGIATGTGSLSLIARVIEDQAPPYKGFVMSKELKSFTTVASGDESTELPLDYPYLSLLVAALKTTIEPQTILTNFKLQRDAGRYVDFDMTGVDLLSFNLEKYGVAKELFRPLKDTTFTWLSDVYAKTGAQFVIGGATGKGLVTTAVGESIGGVFTTGETVDLMTILAAGACPHASFYLPFGDGVNPEDWLNPAGLAELKLILSQGVASGAATIVTSQLRQ